ncbi:hypothetical protein PMAYCL1PPCAC_15132, partial [Pristionchus mayeri]
RDELSWIHEYATSVMVYGDIGNCGTYKYEAFVIIFSIAFCAPIRAFFIVSTIQFLKNQALVASKTMRLKRLIISSLVKQNVCVSIFYIYPLLFNAIASHFQLSFLPNYLLVATRSGIAFLYMVNSLAQFIVVITSNRQFPNVR